MNNHWLVDKLRALHANQSGAIAFMVLCGILISLMMALVIFDATPIARQKLEVQNAADTAAWSHSAVEARSMNMIAFTNVAKRVLMGQALYYISLWEAWAIIMLAMIALLVVLIVACVLSLGTGCQPAVKQGITVANVGIMMAKEAADLFSFLNNIKDRLKADLTGLHNYQTHFQALTPWWAWGESWRRGLRNGAYVSAWPVPDNYMSALSGLPAGLGSIATSSLTDALPITEYPDYGELCIRSLLPDLPIHFADYYVVQTLINCGNDCRDTISGGLIPMSVLYPAAGAIAMGLYFANCAVEFFAGSNPLGLSGYFGTGFEPFQLVADDWLLTTSNLVFAYRPGRDLRGADREKYDFLGEDFTTSMDIVYKPDGFYGMARSEISFQGGSPDMWHPSWSTRMRPVALPNEWSSYPGEFRMVSAFNDTVPFLYTGALLGRGLGMLGISGFGEEEMGSFDIQDIVKAELAFDAMTRNYVDGVAR